MSTSAWIRSVLFVSCVGCAATVTTSPGDGSVDAPPSDVPVVTDRPSTRVPLQHRATANVCPSDRPASQCDLGVGVGVPSMCRADSECTMGVNGRCVGNPHDGCRCNYDTCTRDSDCTTGGPCACRLATRGASGANVCLAGNCRTDGDCGAGGYCSPSFGTCGDYGGVVGYYCHTASDECVDDSDCGRLDAGFLGQRPYCMYAPETGRWVCGNSACAG